jgi:hypothetical protein
MVKEFLLICGTQRFIALSKTSYGASEEGDEFNPQVLPMRDAAIPNSGRNM